MKQTNVILAKRYAKAFLTCKDGKRDLQKSQKLLDDLLSIKEKISFAKKYFLNPVISTNVKKEIFSKIITKKNKTYRFIELLIIAGRFDIFDLICEYAHKLIDELNDIVRTELTGIDKPDKTTIEQLQKIIEKLTGKKPITTFHKNPLVLGGFKLKAEDNLIDASLAGNLTELETNLKEHI